MKKLTAIILCLTMALSLAACGSTEIITSAERKPETVTIQALNANKEMTDIEVPYDPQRIAVERNGDIVFKAEHDVTVLQDGDSLEIVSFVGGG